MVKFCPECGNKIEINTKFCHNCGFNITGYSQQPDSPQIGNTQIDHMPEPEEIDIESEVPENFMPKIDIHMLGRNFENVLEQVYQAEGYTTQTRQKLPGRSGYTNEIDVIAIRGNDRIAIECKNYLAPVGIDKIRDFSEKVRDMGPQWRGIFASYMTFTRDAEEFARDRHIELLTQDEIKERLYTALCGRACIQDSGITVDDALPIHINFPEASDLTLNNKHKITVTRATLTFHPYIRYQYRINRVYYSRESKTSKVYKREGPVIIDLIVNEAVLHDPVKGKEIVSNSPEKSLFLEKDPRFRVVKLDPNYEKRSCYNIARTSVIEHHTRKESLSFTLRKSDVILDSVQPVSLPRWEILFDAFGKVHKREIYACSGAEIIDTISYCPFHTTILGSRNPVRNTIAACEECGESFCSTHGTQCTTCGKWICHNHTITCSICKKPFCKDHISHSCSLCEDYVCAGCLVSCPTCNNVVGKNHMTLCDHCGLENCENCMVEGGIIFEKFYCKGKCDRIVKEENEGKGFFGKLMNRL